MVVEFCVKTKIVKSKHNTEKWFVNLRECEYILCRLIVNSNDVLIDNVLAIF